LKTVVDFKAGKQTLIIKHEHGILHTTARTTAADKPEI
jgi:hypothetical protein